MGHRLSLSAACAAALAFGPGCAGTGMWGKKDAMAVQGVPSAPLSPQVRGDNSEIVQAAASSPISVEKVWDASVASVAKLAGKPERKAQATELTMLWRNRVDYLPDQTRGGQMGAGLAGQLFLYSPGMQFAEADGKLIVALYDETPRPPGQPANKPEGWEFDKETLRRLVTADERFGKCYALFLPWPTFRHDVTRIRIAARYEPEHGFPLYATEMKITLDNSAPGSNPRVEWTEQVVPGVRPGSLPPMGGSSPVPGPSGGPGLGAPPAGYGSLPTPPPGFGTLSAVPPGAMTPSGGIVGAGANAPVNPANLPPIATILTPNR